MATQRNVVLATGEIYHIYNRGVEKRNIFTSKREYTRALDLLWYHRFQKPKLSFSAFLSLPEEPKQSYIKQLSAQSLKVNLFSFCLMPNHFHLLLRQEEENGITRFMSAFSDSYVKFFNTRNERAGPLFQSVFKAVRIEDDEQLLHLSRYIHINPATSFLIAKENLEKYPWSSLSDYFGQTNRAFCNTDYLLSHFPSRDAYKDFIYDQIDYKRSLLSMDKLTLE